MSDADKNAAYDAALQVLYGYCKDYQVSLDRADYKYQVAVAAADVAYEVAARAAADALAGSVDTASAKFALDKRVE